MMTADGAPPAADIEVPTANPLQPNAETMAAVQPPPVAMDDSYTGPAPSAYEAQTANYR